MKRYVTTMSLVLSTALLLMSVAFRTVSAHEVQAKEYISQGLYDEAIQEYEALSFHSKLLRNMVQLFGKFNSFLALTGIFFITTGLLIKTPNAHVKKIKITKDFNWR